MYKNNLKSYEYVGSGLAYPLQIALQGGVQLSSKEENIEESIAIILRTNLGERVNRPNFGSRLSELVFEPINGETLLLTRLYVEESVKMWEPRIHVKEVRAEPDLSRSTINIEIIYQIKNTSDLRSMVYPFYLSTPKE
jgi:uncharacterized protein